MGAEGGGSYAAFAAAFSVPLWTCKNTCMKRASFEAAGNAENGEAGRGDRIHGKEISPKRYALPEMWAPRTGLL